MSDGPTDPPRDARDDGCDDCSRLGIARGTVELVAHDPAWRDAYRREVDRLRTAFVDGDAAACVLGFEHVGSTAVPGVRAKPILDILVLVADPASDGVADALRTAGYEERPDDEVPDRRFFARGPPAARTHYLSVTEPGSDPHREQVAFRDALRADPTLADAYDARKRELAAAHPDDRAAYTAAKSAFVASVLERATE